jgi:hypothetical protein
MTRGGSFFICVRPGRGSSLEITKVTKKRPATQGDERLIRLNLTLPDALFRISDLSATIKVPESAASAREPLVSVVFDDDFRL